MLEKSRELLLAYVIKYKANWDQVFNAVKNREPIEEEEIEKYVNSVSSNYVVIGDENYPNYLNNFNHPPFVLFYYGDISLIKTNEKCLGVVGARDNTLYGETMTRELIKGVSNKLVIVSGLARGIDSIAANECLKNGGKTVAVLGSGIDYCYPKRNINLYNQIKKKGLLVSEYPGDVIPSEEYFPKRNRIIAGLSRHLLVPEARKNSGTSITAYFSMEMGQTIFCVPERAGVDSLPNYLISCGAKITTSAQDILDEYNIYDNEEQFDL